MALNNRGGGVGPACGLQCSSTTKKHAMKKSSLQKFKAMSPDKLGSQTTRALVEALKGSRIQAVCECGSKHCGEGLDKDDNEFNQSQNDLSVACKAMLSTRGHLPRSTKQVKKPEKKALVY